MASADGKKIGPVPVIWAVVVGVNDGGGVHLIDHEYNYEVRAQRLSTLDDIYAAAFIGGQEVADDWEFEAPGDIGTLVHAFVVFQFPNGLIAASPDVFEDLVPVRVPTGVHIMGAFGVLQGQIVAQKTAAAFMAMAETLAAVPQPVADPNKTPGGLIVA